MLSLNMKGVVIMNNNYGLISPNNLISPSQPSTVGIGSVVWLIVSLIIAVIGCFVVYFLFVKKDIKTKNKFVLWLKSFLSFDKMLIETILKIAYIFAAIFTTLASFSLIGTNFLSFLIMLIGGNIVNRVIYEALLIKVMIWKNTTEIKNKIK